MFTKIVRAEWWWVGTLLFPFVDERDYRCYLLLRYFYKGLSLRAYPPPLTRATGCNIVVLLAVHFAILLVAPRAFCSLYHPQDALTNAHPPYFIIDETGMINVALLLLYSENNNGTVKIVPYINKPLFAICYSLFAIRYLLTAIS